MSGQARIIHARGYVRTQVSRIHNDISNMSVLNEVEKSSKKSKLDSYLVELSNYDEQIQTQMWQDKKSESEITVELSNCDQYKDKIFECLSSLRQTAPRTATSSTTEIARSLLKSPVAPLPTFSGGESEDLNIFLNQFKQTTEKFSYTQYDLFLLLKQQVKGSALKLIEALQSNEQSYNDAVKLLKEAYATPELQVHNCIRQLSQVKMTTDGDPFEYYSKICKLSEMIRVLNVDASNFLQYFFWTGLTEPFKQLFVQMTNETRPSLDKLNKNFFEVCQRYKNNKITKSVPNSKTGQTNESTTSYAVKVENSEQKSEQKPKASYNKCALCSHDGKNADHSLPNCKVYSTPNTKLAKIKELKGCTKCGFINHTEDKCRFKFKFRCHCNKFHFKYLCSGETPQLTNKEVKKSPPQATLSTNMVSLTSSFHSTMKNNCIIPTFSCKVNEVENVRILKDSGSQSTFVTNRLDEKCKFQILKNNVNLTLSGFNSNKTYKTKTVLMNLSVDGRSYPVEAVCIPEIKLSVDLPGASHVAQSFVDKNYAIADKHLLDSDKIDNVDIILGAGSTCCILGTEKSFGINHTSVYIDTSIGVMLMGDLDMLKTDVEYLPERNLTDQNINDCSVQNLNLESNCNFGILSDVDIDLPHELTTNVNFVMIGSDGKIDDTELHKACAEILNETSVDNFHFDDSSVELNDKLVDYAQRNTEVLSDGRIKMPLLWRSDVSHLLGHNFHLSKAILSSVKKKLRDKPNYLKMIDDTFAEQEALGIIERIPNLDVFMQEHPNYSFMAHMPVFRLKRESTKCRVVFLSNLHENKPHSALTISHNQSIYSGPNLNSKISTSLLQLRFDKFLLCFDLQKAFSQIQLSDIDSSRLLFLWYKNVSDDNDDSIVAFKSVRLSFGLRCSCCLLMLCLHYILIRDVENDSEEIVELKKHLYSKIYMDNGAISFDSRERLEWAYNNLQAIFAKHKFDIQQLCTNEVNLQKRIRIDFPSTNDEASANVKLLGSQWNCSDDTLSARPVEMNINASTKREVLQTIASQYDALGIISPLLNRSRIFVHKLQCNRDIDWDDRLDADLIREWKNIVSQVNGCSIPIMRSFGSSEDIYSLIACTDSSKMLYGIVVYAHNLISGRITLVMARNRIVNSSLALKSIPQLELQAVLLGVQTLLELLGEMSGKLCILPVKITNLQVWSDSLVALTWIKNYSNEYAKTQKLSIFVNNRLEKIEQLCKTHPVGFKFISGVDNPADCVTRCMSMKTLSKTNYVHGPTIETEDLSQRSSDVLTFQVPNGELSTSCSNFMITGNVKNEPLVDHSRFSDFNRLASVYFKVHKFVNILKSKLYERNPDKFKHLLVKKEFTVVDAKLSIIRHEQQLAFPEIISYFSSSDVAKSKIPELVSRLNIYPDRDGVLRVKSKFDRVNKCGQRQSFPILLPKNSHITRTIISNLHIILNHAGCYTILSELQKKFFVLHVFSLVKSILRTCINCKRYHGRAVKLTQSPYRLFRSNPPKIPYAGIFMDYFGPMKIKQGDNTVKVYILLITCVWTRAVSMQISYDMTVTEFLRSFQIHTLRWGIPQFVVCDLGSNFSSGINIIRTFVNNAECDSYFKEFGVKHLQFDQYFKGRSELGSMVEVLVKLCKQLIYKSIKTNVLPIREFELLICETECIVNKRPIAFLESLRQNDLDIKSPLTPELILHGYELPSINLIPDIQVDPSIDEDNDFLPNNLTKIKDSYNKLKKVRQNLHKTYNSEFTRKLIVQATDQSSRYKPVSHNEVSAGDIVLLVEENTKRLNYPMAIVTECIINAQGEVTGIVARKGKTGELVRRHTVSIIPLLKHDSPPVEPPKDAQVHEMTVRNVPRRAAAAISRKKTSQLLAGD